MTLIDHSLRGKHAMMTVADCNRLYSDPISRELMVNATVDWFVDHLMESPKRDDEPANDINRETPMTGGQ